VFTKLLFILNDLCVLCVFSKCMSLCVCKVECKHVHVRLCTCTCVCVFMCVCECACAHARDSNCVCLCVCVCACACVCEAERTCMRVCTCTSVCVCAFVCVCVRVCVCVCLVVCVYTMWSVHAVMQRESGYVVFSVRCINICFSSNSYTIHQQLLKNSIPILKFHTLQNPNTNPNTEAHVDVFCPQQHLLFSRCYNHIWR